MSARIRSRGLAGGRDEDVDHPLAHLHRLARPAISMSTDWPCAPPWGWWMSTRAFGSAVRMPGAPAARSTAAAEAAWPTQVVATGGREELHRVVDGEQADHVAARRVDVEVDSACRGPPIRGAAAGPRSGWRPGRRSPCRGTRCARSAAASRCRRHARRGRGLDDGGDEHGSSWYRHQNDAQLFGCV